MSAAFRTSTMLSLEQAVGASPSLAALQQRVQDSQRYLAWVSPALPAALRGQVKAGPIQEGEWCLLVTNASVSAKLRQLLPALITSLKENGAQINAIRIKVQSHSR
jgi:hypothetical protein